MPRPRRPQSNLPQPLSIEISQSTLETLLEGVLVKSLQAISQDLQPIASELTALRQQVAQLEQQMQQTQQTLQPLPQILNDRLNHFLLQLQTTLQNETSSTARESLQQQLQQLIAALSTWSNQLKAEVSLQQQLLASMHQLEEQLTVVNLTHSSPPDSTNPQ